MNREQINILLKEVEYDILQNQNQYNVLSTRKARLLKELFNSPPIT